MITIDDLLKNVATYNISEVSKVRKAYDFAKEKHNGQYRQSGEEYISHPVNVAFILSEMHADRDTLIAALLHDTLEDTKTTKEEIAENFGEDVANLVDGVTKISKLNFSSRRDEEAANMKKIITSITKDVRIIIIKLADRLHNMRTISPKSKEKKEENALETIQLYVPLAYLIGAYRIKNELEDISFSILMPEKYKEYGDILEKFRIENEECVKEMLSTLNTILSDNGIPHEMKMRTKNIYGVYKALKKDNKLYDIHDLLALKIMVDDIKNCYMTLCLIHSKYRPINDKFKDFIWYPKTNRYQSLHTTVFGPNERLVQTQIRTFDMDKVASFGLTSYWDINKGLAREKMQEDLSSEYQFYDSIVEIGKFCTSDIDFQSQATNELLNDKIYVYDSQGNRYELPKGATLIDLAYKVGPNIGNITIGGMINGNLVGVGYKLKCNEIVRVLVDNLSYGPRPELLEVAQTAYARRMIQKNSQKK